MGSATHYARFPRFDPNCCFATATPDTNKTKFKPFFHQRTTEPSRLLHRIDLVSFQHKRTDSKEEFMASVGEFRSIQQVAWTNLLPGKPADKITSGPEKLGARYEVLSRLSKNQAAGTPEDWIQDLVTNLRGMLPFDLLDVVVYQKDGNEIQWRSPATTQSPSQDRPIEETLRSEEHTS